MLADNIMRKYRNLERTKCKLKTKIWLIKIEICLIIDIEYLQMIRKDSKYIYIKNQQKQQDRSIV